MKKAVLLIIFFVYVFGGIKNLSLKEAVKIVEKNNKEVKIANLDIKIAKFKTKIAQSYNYGELNLIFNSLRSNDAGNVFGFKLQSREASFADFGFDEFLSPMGEVLEGMNKMYKSGQSMPEGFTKGMGSILNIQPKKLNYPKARNHFQKKLSYMVPIFTGYKLTQYGKISRELEKLKRLDAKKILNEKIFQTKKTFYDIVLVENFIKNLKLILKDVDKLEEIIKAFIAEGYAKDIDLLEVEAKRAEVNEYLNQAKLNRNLAYLYLEFLLDKKVDSIAATSEDVPFGFRKAEELVENTIDLNKAKIGLRITSQNIKLQKSALFPQIGAFGEYYSSDDTLMKDFFSHDAYLVGAQLKWTLFNSQRNKKEIEIAKIEKLKMNYKYALAKKGLALKISQLITEIKSKEYDIKTQQKRLKLAKRVYEHYVQRYKEGLTKISDVLIKHSQKIKVLMELLQVKTQRNQKIFELQSLLYKEIG